MTANTSKLKPEFAHVAARQGVVEGLIPAVESHLAVGGGHDDQRPPPR